MDEIILIDIRESSISNVEWRSRYVMVKLVTSNSLLICATNACRAFDRDGNGVAGIERATLAHRNERQYNDHNHRELEFLLLYEGGTMMLYWSVCDE